jgi:rubrerythrin
LSLERTFYQAKAAEVQISNLYNLISLSVSISQPALSDLFKELADEEMMHAKQIELLQSVFQQAKERFTETPRSESIIADFLQNVETAKRYFNQKHLELKPSDLIGLAIDLEHDLLEKHNTFFMNVDDPQIKQLFASLNLADEAHIRKLEGWFKS